LSTAPAARRRPVADERPVDAGSSRAARTTCGWETHQRGRPFAGRGLEQL